MKDCYYLCLCLYVNSILFGYDLYSYYVDVNICSFPLEGLLSIIMLNRNEYVNMNVIII